MADDPLVAPRRQPPIAMVAQLLSVAVIRQFGELFLPLVVVGLASRGPLLYVAAPVAMGLVVAGVVLGWWRTTFWADENELIVEKGIFNRTRLQVPFDRVQQITTEQGIVQQVFGVRRVVIDTAGSVGAELSFAALTDDVVAALRLRLVGLESSSSMTPSVSHDDETWARSPEGPSAAPMGRQPREGSEVLRFGVKDLMLIGLAHPGIGAIGGLLALSGLGLGRAFDRFVENNITSAARLVLFVVFAIVVSMAWLIGASVARDFDLTVWRGDHGLRLSAGLFNKRELYARTERVQLVRHRTNPLERRLGRTSLSFPQASAIAGADGSTGGRVRLFAVPGVPDALVVALAGLFVERPAVEASNSIDELAARRWSRWGVEMPAAVMVVAAVVLLAGSAPLVVPSVLTVGAIAAVPVGRSMVRAGWRRWRWSFDGRVVWISHGLVVHHRVDVPARKIQAVEVSQSWWQRRHRLSSVRCRTAGGAFSIPHLPLATATSFRDHVLMAVETDCGPWM